MYSIYCITNTINGKQYVGMTSKSVHDRWRKHVIDSKHEYQSMYDNPLQADIRKYGEDCFTYRVLVTTEDKVLAMQLEDIVTEELNTTIPNGYNRQVGYHRKPTKKTKHKMSEKLKGRTLSEETKKKLSEKAKGRTLSEETRKKMSESKRGENNHNYGKHLSEEHKKKISESNSGKNHPNYGKHRSEETKKKLYRPVMCVETGVVFKNLTDACEWAGLKSYTSISHCCAGRQKTAGNYHWEYVKEE